MANSANVAGLRKLLRGELEGVVLYRALAGIELRPELQAAAFISAMAELKLKRRVALWSEIPERRKRGAYREGIHASAAITGRRT